MIMMVMMMIIIMMTMMMMMVMMTMKRICDNINEIKIKVMSFYTVMLYIYLVYTKPVGSIFRALLLATQ